MGDDGHAAAFIFNGRIRELHLAGHQVGSAQVLRGKNAIQRVKRKMAAIMKKVGEVRLPKTRLAGEERDAECPPLNSAQQLKAQVLVHLGEVHLWRIRHQQWSGRVLVCCEKSNLLALSRIFATYRERWMSVASKGQPLR